MGVKKRALGQGYLDPGAGDKQEVLSKKPMQGWAKKKRGRWARGPARSTLILRCKIEKKSK